MIRRRDFLAAGAVAAIGAPAVMGSASQRKFRTALIGTGWWGTNILREAIGSGRCEVVGLCDVDEAQVESCRSTLAGMVPGTAKTYKDYRELIEKEKPEIAIVATADHWHPLIAIAACDAGAHVYVEKPISHTILEGRAMVNAARKNDRVVQVGTHRRVSPHNVSGMEFLKSGKAGKIGMVRAFVHYGGGPEEPTPNEKPHDGLDWDLWCGPAPYRPFNRAIHPKGFRNFLDYGNGTLGDWGIHWMDQILWWTDETAPKRVASFGGRPVAGPAVNDGKAQTSDGPDHQAAIFEFDGFTATWEHRKFAANNAEKTHPEQAVGCYFYGTEGTFHMGWLDGWTFYPSDPKKAAIHVDPKLGQPDDQNIKELFADFLGAIDEKRRSISDIEVGHRSTNMSLLAMLAMKLERSIAWDPKTYTIPGDEEATKGLRREYRGDWKYPT